MAGEIFNSIAKGLSEFMPQDDPDVKMLKEQTKLNELKDKEKEIYSIVGKQVMESEETKNYPEQSVKLAGIKTEIAEVEAKIEELNREKEEREANQMSGLNCSSCGHVNPEGTRFCQECGTKLEETVNVTTNAFCPQCGAALIPGTRFCGSCGAKVSE